MAKPNDETYMGWIQLHERAWGTEHYEARPNLQAMLDAPVLAFWYPIQRHDQRFTATIHSTMYELNAYATHLLIHSGTQPPKRRLARLFVDRRRVRIRGVRVLIEEYHQDSR